MSWTHYNTYAGITGVETSIAEKTIYNYIHVMTFFRSFFKCTPFYASLRCKSVL